MLHKRLVLSLLVLLCYNQPTALSADTRTEALERIVCSVSSTDFTDRIRTRRYEGPVGIRFDSSVDSATRNYIVGLLPKINRLIEPEATLFIGEAEQQLWVYCGDRGMRNACAAQPSYEGQWDPDYTGWWWAMPSGLPGRYRYSIVWFKYPADSVERKGTVLQELTQALGPGGDHPGNTIWRDGTRGVWFDYAEELALFALYNRMEGNESPEQTRVILAQVLVDADY